MKTKILTLLFLALAQFAFAQKEPIPYEKVNNFSKTISEILLKMNGKYVKFNHEIGVLNINKDAFQVYTHNGLASMGSYHKDILYLFEDFDLAKVESLILKNDRVVIYFIDSYVSVHKKISYDKNNDVAEKLIFGYPVTLYFETEDDGKKLLNALYHLINTYKIDKGLITETETRRHWEEYQSLKPYEFYKKHPQSVLAYEGKLLEEDYKRQVKFVNKLAEQYKVPVMGKTSASEFSNNEVMRYYKKRRNTYGGEALMPIKKKIEEGKNFISLIVTGKGREYDDEIQLFGYTVLIDKDYNLVKQKYNELKNELKNNLDAEFISEQKENSIRFYLLREGKVGKDITSKSVKNISSIEIFFHEHTYKKEKWYELYVQY